MPVTDVSEDLKKRRKKNKTARFLKKFIVLIIVAGITLTIILTKSLWYPKLDGILTKIPSSENSTELAEGYFPLSIEGGASYQLSGMDSGICVLDDSRFFSYSLDGKPIFTSQHSFARPTLTTSSKKALIYDLGGKNFELLSKYKSVYSIKTEHPILLARISSNDTAAIVTQSDKFGAQLFVYDLNGNNIFNYSSITKIIDVCFNSDNNGCYITTVGSKGGEIVSQILYYRFDKIDYSDTGNPIPIWSTDYIDTLVLTVKLFGDDSLIVFGDNKCLCYDRSGKFVDSYSYSQTLNGFSSAKGVAALIFEDTERRCSTFVTFNNETKEFNEIYLDYVAMNVESSGGYIFIHSRHGILVYDNLGNFISDITLESDYEDFERIDKYIYLLGYDEINRINYS